MKRWMGILAVALVGAASLWALPLDNSSSCSWAMADAGLALDYFPDSFAANPALLALEGRSETSFLATVRYLDEISTTSYRQHEVNPFLQRPVADWSLSFAAGRLAFSIQNRNTLAERTNWASYSEYRGLMTTLFQFDWAIGKKPLSFGFTARALAGSERTSIRLREGHAILDYAVETVVGRYEQVEDQSNVAFGMGLLLDYDWFKLAVVSNSFAYSSLEAPLVISADSLLKTLDWGFSFSSPTYDENNQLHLLKAEGALDFLNIGSDEEREVRLGLSLKMQLLPTWSVSLLTGYREQKPLPTDLLQTSFERGLQTLGISARFETIHLQVAYGWPTSWYVQKSSSQRSKFLLGASITL
jgi:hypothetical protein